MLSAYPAFFYIDDDGCSVIFPDLNWLSTCGDNLEDALEMAVDCLAGYLYDCKKDGETPPKPSDTDDLDPIAAAKECAPDAPVGKCFVNIVSVDVAAYAKEHFEKSVKKTLSIPSWLNKAALEKGINFSQTLQEALIAKLNASK